MVIREVTKRRSFSIRVSVQAFLVILLVAISCIIFVVQRKNYLQNNLDKYHPDEIHTVDGALKTRTSYRVGEGTRWFARFLIPAALIYMNKHLGGDHYTQGWNFPSLKYYKSKFNANKLIKNGIEDPGLQDFFYFLRLQYVVIFAFFFIFFILFYFYKEKDYMTPFLITIYFGGVIIFLENKRSFTQSPY